MQQEQELQAILDTMEELQQDSTIPKNLKGKLELLNSMFKSDDGDSVSIKVHKAIHELGEITEDVNIESYTRTQVWNLVSLLEGIQ